jgi:ATP-dependent DNA helicase DinG
MGTEFRFALCLGAQNYICPRRLAKAEVGGLFASRNEVDELKEINSFARKSKTGRNIDLPFEPSTPLWAQVNRESDLCMGRACPLYDKSFFYIARREQEKAHVLIANHHLLFAHLAAGGNDAGAVLPAFDALVMDEAHQAEEVASAYLGIEVVNLGAARLIEVLHNRRSGRTVLSGSPLPKADELDKKLVEAADEAREATGRFFENLQLALNVDPSRMQTIRLRRPHIVENSLDEPLGRLEGVLKEARKRAEAIAMKRSFASSKASPRAASKCARPCRNCSTSRGPVTFTGPPSSRALTTLAARDVCRVSPFAAPRLMSRRECRTRSSARSIR